MMECSIGCFFVHSSCNILWYPVSQIRWLLSAQGVPSSAVCQHSAVQLAGNLQTLLHVSLPLDTSHWVLNSVASSFSILCHDLLIIHKNVKRWRSCLPDPERLLYCAAYCQTGFNMAFRINQLQVDLPLRLWDRYCHRMCRWMQTFYAKKVLC